MRRRGSICTTSLAHSSHTHHLMAHYPVIVHLMNLGRCTCLLSGLRTLLLYMNGRSLGIGGLFGWVNWLASSIHFTLCITPQPLAEPYKLMPQASSTKLAPRVHHRPSPSPHTTIDQVDTPYTPSTPHIFNCTLPRKTNMIYFMRASDYAVGTQPTSYYVTYIVFFWCMLTGILVSSRYIIRNRRFTAYAQ